MLNCYLSHVSSAITQKAIFCPRKLCNPNIEFQRILTLFPRRQNSRQTILQSLLIFKDTADPSPVSVLQLRGSGTRLQRGNGSGADYVWLGLVDHVKGSQRVVGREHKRAPYPKKDSPSLYCMIICIHPVTKLNTCLSGLDFLLFWLKTVFGWADKSIRCLGHKPFG